MSRHPHTGDNTERSFLKRWSRRKARSEQSGDADGRPALVQPEAVEGPEAEVSTRGEEAPEPVKTDEDMPDLDAIDENTDMSGFFSPGVSQELRTRALRRLFRLSKFNVVDALDDYNEDYRRFTPLGDIVTADMRQRMERALQRPREPDGEKNPARNGEADAAQPARAGDRATREDQRAAEDSGESGDAGETNHGGTDPDGDAETQV